MVMKKSNTILIIGAGGVLGTAISEQLVFRGFDRVLTPTKLEMDCLNEQDVFGYLEREKPDYVFHLASLVYGIKGNMHNQANSFRQNTLMSLYVLNACAQFGVKKVFYAGTVASYPYPYPEFPLKEESFWSGKPHYGEYGYALAKRNTLGHLEILKNTIGMDFCYGIFTNLYGKNDKFNTETGHVIPSLVAKAASAEKSAMKELAVWGNPTVTRDFLYADDAANAAILAMDHYSGEINIASGIETSMGEVSEALLKAAEVPISVRWVGDQPIGIPKRYSDITRLTELGFKAKYDIDAGVKETLSWYKANPEKIRR